MVKGYFCTSNFPIMHKNHQQLLASKLAKIMFLYDCPLCMQDRNFLNQKIQELLLPKITTFSIEKNITFAIKKKQLPNKTIIFYERISDQNLKLGVKIHFIRKFCTSTNYMERIRPVAPLKISNWKPSHSHAHNFLLLIYQSMTLFVVKQLLYIYRVNRL